jgi:CheY-like chemotaxis protein
MRTVIVLDDEPSVMNFLRLVLLTGGYAVVEAACAQQALGRCAESNQSISLIIADVSPPCSGIGVSLQIKALIPSLNIILTSGYPVAMWPDQEAARLNELPHGSVRMLLKPFTASSLLSIVNEMIGPSDGVCKSAATG